MRILVLGGTVFLGRHIVEASLADGHEVTLFNRGIHLPDLFPDVEKLRGDRGGDLEALVGREWDAVIDTSGHVPADVRRSCRLLAPRTNHYTFISSINVYPDYGIVGIDESATVDTIEGDEPTEMTFENYGALKALCEAEVERAMPGRNSSIRAGLIVGPHDYSDRFTYWPTRVAAGGRVLAPGSSDRQIQMIDVRDLAAWVVKTAVDNISGVYNATGPDRRLTMGTLLTTCANVCGVPIEVEWVEDDFLVANNVGPWIELPLWIPRNTGSDGLFQINIDRARRSGLAFRPLEETIGALLQWTASLPADRTPRAGMSAARERELLALWDER